MGVGGGSGGPSGFGGPPPGTAYKLMIGSIIKIIAYINLLA